MPASERANRSGKPVSDDTRAKISATKRALEALKPPKSRTVEQQKSRARGLLKRAIRDNVIVKLNACEECRQAASHKGLHGHHHNGYSDENALDVVWLCRSCHSTIHNGWHDPERRNPDPPRPHEFWVAMGRKSQQQQQNLTAEERSQRARRGWETRRSQQGNKGTSERVEK